MYKRQVAKVISATDASSKTTGALIVTGGVGISKNIHALNANFEDVEAGSVTVTDNTTSSSATTGALKVVGGISTQENLNVGAVAKVISATDASSKTSGALIVTGGVGISKNIHALHANFEDVEADSVTITDTTTSTSDTTGALKVVGGISTQENLNVGGTTDASSKTTGALIVSGGVGISKNIHALHANFEDVEADSVTVTDTTVSSSKTTGAVKVAGGLGVAGAIFGNTGNFDGTITVGGDLIVSGNTTSQGQNSLTVSDPTIEVGINNVNGTDLGLIMNNPLTGGNKGNVAIIYDFSASKLEIGHTLKSSADSVITMNTANALAVNINGDLGVTGTTDASSKTTGALIVTGGLGVAKNIHALHANFEDVEADSVTITDNTTSDSATTGALKVVGGISTQENLNVGAVAKVISATDASSKTTGALIVTGGVGISKNIHALHANFEGVEADSVNITDTTVSSSKTTGALKVAGGLGVAGNVHSSNIFAGYDLDLTSYVGRAAVGFAGETNHASFAHIDNNTAGNYALKQTEGGTTHVNAKAGQHIRLNINNSEKARLTGAGDLKIGSNVLYVDVSETSIGVNTASPEAKLHVVGNAYVSSTTDATTTTTGALIVAGGLGIAKKIVGQHANFEDVEADSVTVTDTTESKLRTNGALIVAGGIGVASNVNTTNLHALGTTSTLSKTTGTVIVAGGVGVSGNIHALHANFEDVEADSVTITDTTTSTSATTGALKVAGGISTQENLNVGGDLKVDTSVLVVNSTTNRVGVNKASPAYGLDVVGDINFTGDLYEGGSLFVSTPWTIESSPTALSYTSGNVGVGAANPAAKLTVTGDAQITTTLNVGGVVTLTDTTESTSSTTGALKAAGGVGIAKDVFVGERAYVTGGLVTNTGGVGRKTYSYSADLGSGASVANATYVLDFTNHAFHAKVTAMLIESADASVFDQVSTLIFDVIGGKIGGSGNSQFVPALGQQSIISTSTMNTPWDSTIATSLTGTTVTIKPANACNGVVRFNIFVEYLCHETAGELSSITNSGTSVGSGAFGY